ncbi:hybrid sensor histidine kinase/response regulator [Zavarzinia sp. CC-PAN008]|uniref:hybrid sensor histidine kinase/response regulator n=1 Tax=Zavarzinia sp. CC-PAN008 TaxID=3243332 RepID=UPI003F7460AC
MVARQAELRRRLLAMFVVEAAGHLRTIDADLDALEDATRSDGSDAERLESLFRAIHTLKGAARSVGIGPVEEICQRGETLLSNLRRGSTVLDGSVVRTLRDLGDAVAHAVAASRQAGQEPEGAPVADAQTAPMPPPAPPPDAAPSAPPPPAQPVDDRASVASEPLRIDGAKLEALSHVAEELLLPRLAVSDRRREAQALSQAVSALRARLTPDVRSPAERALEADLREVEQAARRLSQSLAGDHVALETLVGDLALAVRDIRMTPVADLLALFGPMIRDLSRETGRAVEWQPSGGDLLIDRRVMDALRGPLIHLVRNAVDHGIEAPAEREAQGKPAMGRVTMNVAQGERGRIAITIADDGRGFDTEALRDAAVRARALSVEEAAALDEEALRRVAFVSGVSTSPVISRISGHGLGLAIVREQVERIDGTVAVDSRRRRGTTIRIEVPASISTYHGLLVEVDGQLLLCPRDALERTVGVPRAAVAETLARGLLVHGGWSLPVAPLGDLLGLPPAAMPEDAEAPSLVPAIVVRSGERRGVLLVDRVHGEAEVVVKEFPSPIRRLGGILAVGLLGTGQLALILRVADLLAAWHAPRRQAHTQTKRNATDPLRILVVDDSLTTRAMERNLFETAGYSVRLAFDGLDAWEILQTEGIDLVVSDIDMPRMDGFALTERIRADARLSDLPVVLVTALESREDKERGIRVGASAYVLKSGFDQSNLLDIVARLI